jgi:hypothetical protein
MCRLSPCPWKAATKARTEPRTHVLPNSSVNEIIIKLDE